MIREEDGSIATQVSISSPRCVMDSELLRILVIEDNPTDARMIGECLTRASRRPVELEHVRKLSDGLTQLASGRFDVVLLDLALEDSSGVETVVRVHACNRYVPIVVLTGTEADDVALDALKSGAEDFLYKSELEPGLLLRSIHYAIERVGHRQSEQQFRDEEARYRQLLAAVTTYTYSVKFANGSPVSTHHSLGCLSATGYTRRNMRPIRISGSAWCIRTTTRWSSTTWHKSFPASRLRPSSTEFCTRTAARDGYATRSFRAGIKPVR